MNRASIFFISAKLKKGPLTLQGSEFHFMVRVSRHQTGETVTLFDGTGREAEAEIKHVSRDAARLLVGKVVTVPESPGPQLVLAVSMPSAARAVRLIEQAVELGVTRLIPLHTARTVPPARGFSLEKIQDSIVSASRLSGRSRLMEVDSQMSWSQLLTSKLMGPGTIVAHPGGASLNEALPQAVNAAASAGSPGNGKRILPVVAVAGPHAGLTIDEIIAAVTHGATLVDLGPRPLRTDTAALMMACLFTANTSRSREC